jgi:hypothetical protein
MAGSVWVFHAENGHLTSAVFTKESLAEAWIKKHSLSGMLTEYLLDVVIYEWAISKGYFKPKHPYQQAAKFIGRFTSANLSHGHFKNGEKAAGL